MATVISMSQTTSNQMSSSVQHHIPKEIILQSYIMSSAKKIDPSRVMCPLHTEQAASRPNSQTVCDDDKKVESRFNGGIISLSSENDLYNDLPDMMPLDFRVGQSTDDCESLGHDMSQNTSFFISDIALMEVDSLCESQNKWAMESICGDSLDTEEDMDSIPEWINGEHEDFWDFSQI